MSIDFYFINFIINVEVKKKMSELEYVDDSTFEAEVINSVLPVLVDFSANWCGPCQKQLPILEKFASSNLETLKIVKVDIDESPQIASSFGIRSVPSMILFKNGKKLDIKVGLTSLQELEKFVFQKLELI